MAKTDLERAIEVVERRKQTSINALSKGDDDAYWQGSASCAEILLHELRALSEGEGK